MTDPAGSGTPPEVSEEFAAAYWAAYEAALEAQSVPVKGDRAERVVSTPLDHQVELPQRARAIRIGTHRSAKKSRPFETVASATSSGTRLRPSSGTRVSESPWFVPVLLIGLALLLVLGAYVLGRAFAHSVGADAEESVVVVGLGPRAVP